MEPIPSIDHRGVMVPGKNDETSFGRLSEQVDDKVVVGVLSTSPPLDPRGGISSNSSCGDVHSEKINSINTKGSVCGGNSSARPPNPPGGIGSSSGGGGDAQHGFPPLQESYIKVR